MFLRRVEETLLCVAGCIRGPKMALEPQLFTPCLLILAIRGKTNEREKGRESEAETSAMFYYAQSAQCFHLNQH